MLDKYAFKFEGEQNNSYLFTTQQGVVYEIKFKDFFYFFDVNAPYSHFTYEFVIEVLDKTENIKIISDSRIPPTIVAIFDDFYARYSETVVIYICDSSDSKQMARQRKFSSWFIRFNKEHFFKVDAFLSDAIDEIIPISIVVRRDNPYKYQILQDFERITDGYSNEK